MLLKHHNIDWKSIKKQINPQPLQSKKHQVIDKQEQLENNSGSKSMIKLRETSKGLVHHFYNQI